MFVKDNDNDIVSMLAGVIFSGWFLSYSKLDLLKGTNTWIKGFSKDFQSSTFDVKGFSKDFFRSTFEIKGLSKDFQSSTFEVKGYSKV